MNEPYFNYDIAYDVYTKQIKKMAVGSIKRTGIKKQPSIKPPPHN